MGEGVLSGLRLVLHCFDTARAQLDPFIADQFPLQIDILLSLGGYVRVTARLRGH